MSYSENLPLVAEQDREVYNQAFKDAMEFIEPVILNRTVEQPRVFVNMIPRTAYGLGRGLVQKQWMFWGDRGVQGGATGWSPIQVSRAAGTNGPGDAGYNACKDYEAEFVEHGMEERLYSGYQRNRRTYDLCINSVKWTHLFQEQIALIYGNLADITLQEWDNLGREAYIKHAKKYVMAGGNPNSVTFNYDPFKSTQITMASNLNVSALQWDFLKWFHIYLSLQARPSATGGFSGQPVWTLVMDPEDFDSMLHRDPALMNSYNFARPQVLLDNYGSVDYFKGFTLNYDMQTPRFKIVSDNGTTCTLERVDYRVYTDAEKGVKHEVNPDYMNAEYALGIIYLKDTIELQVPPAGPASPGGGTKFGIVPNLMGQFSWVNILHRTENPFGEIGHYFARFQAFIRPLRWDGEGIVFMYRRMIKNPVVSLNPGMTDPVMNVITGTVIPTQPTVGAGDILTTSTATKIVGEGETANAYTQVTVTLASLLGCESPSNVTVKYGNGFGSVATATIIADRDAPTYTLVFQTAADWATLMGAIGAAKVACA